MDSNNKLKQYIRIISVCMICVIIFIFCLSACLSSGKKEKADLTDQRIVAQIENMTVTEAEFRFFANMLVIENEDMVKELYSTTDISPSDELKKNTSNFAKEYMIRVLEATKNGVSLTAEEKDTVAKQIEQDFSAIKEEENISEEEFFEKYYNLTKEQYVKFWENWSLIDKYTEVCKQNADVSKASQEAAFDEYYDYLYTYNASVIPFVITTENTAEVQKQQAAMVLERLNNGEDFVKLLNEFSNDEALLKTDGVTKFYPANKDDYAEVYDWLRVNPVGSVGIVESQYAVYLVRLDSITDFEALCDSETMIKWTRMFVADKNLKDLLESDKYEYKLNDEVYSSLDLSDIVDTAFEYWSGVWENGNS